MSASNGTSRTKFSTVRSFAGDTVTLHCKLSPKINKVTREIRWFKGTECIHQEVHEKGGEHMWAKLTLRNVKVMDYGQYRCEAHGERKEEVAIIYLHVAELKLVTEPDPSSNFKIKIKTFIDTLDTINTLAEDEATLPCYLSPERSAVDMEIRWFKGTDCICLYQNGQVKQGKGYEGRVRLLTHNLEEGNVSLMLSNVQKSDVGEYKCEVTHQECKLEISGVYLQMPDFKLISKPEEHFTFWMRKTSIAKPHIIKTYAGYDTTLLPCYLSPKMSAVAMEIRWFKGTDCICVYQNGQVKEGKGYEGRVCLLTHELEEGNVSLMLSDVQVSDGGEYKCEVTHEEYKVENSGVDLQVSGNY
ncbi:muscle M-line assembly protein unc-89-like [Clarias gariepinus]|uniref:muscle M-line assembly protein unc-89-like n=1 Tax=Clarias gariepinus TaxID=13013 RepID=UPI00234C3536|nr:muscle M-line assembly protein unc-89-like [Clarias gariepinus]